MGIYKRFSAVLAASLLGATLVAGAGAPAQADWGAKCTLGGQAYSSGQHPAGVTVYKILAGTNLWPGYGCMLGKTRFVMQNDGNLVVYDENNNARWASGTMGNGAVAVFQTDGNLVVYNNWGHPTWSSGTWGHEGQNLFLGVQSDGNVVIYDQGWNWYWATGTSH